MYIYIYIYIYIYVYRIRASFVASRCIDSSSCNREKKKKEKKKRAHRGVEIIAFPCVVNSFLIFSLPSSYIFPLFLFFLLLLLLLFLLLIKITPIIELDDLFSHRHFKTTVESLFSIAGFPFFRHARSGPTTTFYPLLHHTKINRCIVIYIGATKIEENANSLLFVTTY